MTSVEFERDVGRADMVLRPNADLASEIEAFIKSAPNNAFLGARLKTLDDPERLTVFLHRFLIFNDALAARVPYLAGLIHLTPNLFLDPRAPRGFLGQVNARIAAHVAEAANDEYRMPSGRNMVHQHLSQNFFRGVLAFYRPGLTAEFEHQHPVPTEIDMLLTEARTKFFVAPTSHDIFAALGFHVGLEFFANEEFNLVDHYLGNHHARLVAALKNGGKASNDYTWLALHTVVEIGHYRAGLEAVREAIAFYRDPSAAASMADVIMDGLEAFADLQQRYYRAVFAGAS